MTALAELAEHCGRGWRLLPIWGVQAGVEVAEGKLACACGRLNCQAVGKHPLIRDWRREASSDASRIEEWVVRWPGCNWAVATGPGSGVVVVDCDLDEVEDGWVEWCNWLNGHSGYELPPTTLARTGSGGVHVYLQDDGRAGLRNAVRWLPGVDLRADGGYVLLPGSKHSSGGEYAWLASPRDWPPVVMEDWLAVALVGARSRVGHAAGERMGDTPVYDYLEAKRSGAKLGSRDDFFNSYAFELRRMGVDRDQARDALREAWARCEQTPTDQMTWAVVEEKLERVWRTVEPSPVAGWSWLPGTGGGGRGGAEGEGSGSEGGGSDDGGSGGPRELDTDTGNAQRLSRWFGDRLKYTPGFGWRYWIEEHGWRSDAEGLEALRLTERVVSRMWLDAVLMGEDDRDRWLAWCKTSESRRSREAMVRLAQAQPEVRQDVGDWDSDPFALRVANGVVDLRTGELRPVSRKDLIAHGSRVVYDPEARSATLKNFLHTVTGGDEELIRYLKRAAGYTLTGSTDEEVFFILSGKQASGKSTFLDALSAAIGTLGGTVPQKVFLASTRDKTADNALASFQGKRLMMTVEFNQADRFNTGLLKDMTGRDEITGEFKYQNPFSYRPQFKIWMATNHDPIVGDAAVWRRVRQIPFPRTIPAAERRAEVKSELVDPRSEAARAFLAWAVEGCLEWQREGLGTSYAVDLATATWQENDDVIGEFIRDETVESADSTGLQETYERYRVWAASGGLQPMTKIALGRVLRERGWMEGRLGNARVWLHHKLTQSTNAYGL